MIRTSRVFFFGKNFWEAPLFSQHRIQKQVSVKFSVADKEVESTFNEPTKQSLQDTSKHFRSYQDIKYSFMKQLLNVRKASRQSSEIGKSDPAIDQFLIDLPTLTPPEIIEILKLFSETNNRPIASIKALCAVLDSHSNWSNSCSNCCDLLYSLAKLSYRDEKLCKKAAESLKKIDIDSPKTASTILFSLGELRFRDSELLNKLVSYVLLNAHSVKGSLNCLRAVSFLNYQSKEVDELIKFLTHLKEVDFIQSTDYVTFVWVTVMLNKLEFITYEQISRVLSEEFVTRLLNNGMHPFTKWKLLNINGAVRQLKDYNGPLLNDHSQFKIMSLTLPKQKGTILESVLDTLSYIVPQSANLKPLVNVGAGFYLDFEFCDESEKSEEKENKSSKTGILLLGYNDICSDNTLSGISAFKVNILKGLGYKVVLLKHSEYCPSDPLSLKIELLRKKIQEDITLTQASENLVCKKQ